MQLHGIKKGKIFWKTNSIEKAKKTFEDAIELFPKDASSILNYSELLIALGKFDDARKSIEKAIDVFPSIKDKQNMQVMKITLVIGIIGTDTYLFCPYSLA
ncbi:tetratricopeptide repeat protein [bacterium]|nr:tetratricopeptide repeat protein [bacterium]MBU4511031.1 tetratricopeptide repeat protein [bacterium]